MESAMYLNIQDMFSMAPSDSHGDTELSSTEKVRPVEVGWKQSLCFITDSSSLPSPPNLLIIQKFSFLNLKNELIILRVFHVWLMIGNSYVIVIPPIKQL